MKILRKVLRFWLHHDPDGLEIAKQADVQAGEDLARARQNGRLARRLLAKNHLTERFITELRHGGHA